MELVLMCPVTSKRTDAYIWDFVKLSTAHLGILMTPV